MSLGQVQGIIFDLDDTLFDYAEWLKPALRAGAQQVGLDGLAALGHAENYIALHGRADDGIFNFVLTASGQVDNARTISALYRAVQAYSPADGDFEFFPGVKETLLELSRKYKLGLLESCGQEVDEGKVRALGLGPLIPFRASLATFGTNVRWPDSRPLQDLRCQMGLQVEQVLLVADNPYKDFGLARRMGMLTCRVLTGRYRDCQYPSVEHEAHYNVTSVAKLPELLAGSQDNLLQVIQSMDFLHKSTAV